MNVPRDYDMTRRTAQAERTRVGILEALLATASEVPLASVTLPRVAARAGVTVQTVLRNFGSRDGLLAAGVDFGRARVVAERTIDPDDPDRSLAALVEHYERTAAQTLLLLGQEDWEPIAAQITTGGKALHRDWVERVFAAAIAAASDPDEAIDLLVVATDLYTYKLLRLDRRLSRETTLRRMQRLVASVIRSI